MKGVGDTQESMAKDAAAAGDYKRAAQSYEQLVGSKKGTPEQVLRYKIGWADSLRRIGDGGFHDAFQREGRSIVGEARSGFVGG